MGFSLKYYTRARSRKCDSSVATGEWKTFMHRVWLPKSASACKFGHNNNILQRHSAAVYVAATSWRDAFSLLSVPPPPPRRRDTIRRSRLPIFILDKSPRFRCIVIIIILMYLWWLRVFHEHSNPTRNCTAKISSTDSVFSEYCFRYFQIHYIIHLVLMKMYFTYPHQCRFYFQHITDFVPRTVINYNIIEIIISEQLKRIRVNNRLFTQLPSSEIKNRNRTLIFPFRKMTFCANKM